MLLERNDFHPMAIFSQCTADYYRQTDAFVKTGFSDSGCLKTQRYDENFDSNFSHETNTFPYDENVKIKFRHSKQKFYSLLISCVLAQKKIKAHVEI